MKNQIVQPDGSSAGGHWNPTLRNTENGVLANIKGDIGNFTADANGNENHLL
jgi:Cu/Zn superoxide dismutase